MEAGFRIAWSRFLGPVMLRLCQIQPRRGRCLPKVGRRLPVPCARNYRAISNSRCGLRYFSGPTLLAPDFCELCLKQRYSTRSTSQHSRRTDAFLYILSCSKLAYEWTSNTCTRPRAFTALFGSWLGADELCPVAGAAQRGDGGLPSCLSLRQSMAMDRFCQCLHSSVYSDARHRETITQTPLTFSFKITWRYPL